jgi:hypothetical protein
VKYQLYIVKKFYEPLEVEADSPSEAEELAYAMMEADNLDGKHNSDDTYIYFDGEV